MANVFYETGAGRAEKVKNLFGSIARRYDLINDVQSFGLHRLWKRRLVRLAEVEAGQRALDLCCGTGDIAMALAGRGARVTGLDFSEPMLAVAREKKLNGAGQVPEFIQGDAQAVPFPDHSFDRVTVGYGLRNLASLETGLREMHRVTRPGGR
ncbi:MAG: ubiquinone/menaquinone biosynthesis methyltransferase, partial [Verrucomicrobiota bacterium]